MAVKKASARLKIALITGILVILAAISPVIGNGNPMAAKDPDPEEIVTRSIIIYGLYSVQKNGILRSLVKFISPDGTREGKSVVKFLRNEKMSEDLRLVDLELPGTNYTIGYDGKEIWSVFNGEVRKPGENEVIPFKSSHAHGFEALLRYKQNNAKLEYAGSTKLGTLDLDIVDMILPDGSRTRFEISRRTYRIIYLNYEERPSPEAEPVKYRIYFKDFRAIQNALIPYSTMVFQNGKLIEERTVVEAVFNVQLEEKDFKAENNIKPSEPPPGL